LLYGAAVAVAPSNAFMMVLRSIANMLLSATGSAASEPDQAG
jgi:hypothetical protein